MSSHRGAHLAQIGEEFPVDVVFCGMSPSDLRQRFYFSIHVVSHGDDFACESGGGGT